MNRWISLAADLRALSQMPLNTENERKACCECADRIQHHLNTENKDMTNTLPHFVWHYLADADIRFKDKSYRRSQDAEIAEIIKELEQRK
jgi:hypothetical protein